MESFAGKRAVVTGGGSGMGRELVIQLAAEGCSVATCDVNAVALAETLARAEAGAPSGTRVTTHICDVSDEAQVLGFRDEVAREHGDVIELLFNNAGIGGGGSLFTDSREDWERTFGVDWWGVYYCTRAFLPLLVAAGAARLVNTSSVNGFWASLGPGVPHTAYSTAKFAVKGFSEALIEDLRVNAPHVQVSVVMPGHIGTMSSAVNKDMNAFPVRWYVIDEDRGWVVCSVINRMADPGDGSVHEADSWTRLEYAGDGRFSLEEDMYNPNEFAAMISSWSAARKGG
jgi:NAD(P)-dependent dehydrogenase (short-subunit alcohol dehydrogenase family)